MTTFDENYYEEMMPDRPSMTDALLKKGVKVLYARMRPYNPKKGQPTKTYNLAPLQIRFEAGEFKKVHVKLAKYLEGIHPEEDVLRPPLFLIVSKEQMDAMRRREVTETRRKRAAQALGEEYKPGKGGGMSRADQFELQEANKMPSIEDIEDFGDDEDRLAGFEKHAKGQFDDLWEELSQEHPPVKDDPENELAEIAKLEAGEIAEDADPEAPLEDFEFEDLLDEGTEQAQQETSTKGKDKAAPAKASATKKASSAKTNSRSKKGAAKK